MEWGTFITVIIAVYLVYYGFVFLFDLLGGSKSKAPNQAPVHYNISDLVSSEEPAQIIEEKDYQEPLAAVIPVAAAPAANDAPATGGVTLVQSDKLPVTDFQDQQPPLETAEPDWVVAMEERLENERLEKEQIINIPVQGQPVSVTEFLQSFKTDAANKAASIFS